MNDRNDLLPKAMWWIIGLTAAGIVGSAFIEKARAHDAIPTAIEARDAS